VEETETEERGRNNSKNISKVVARL